MTTYNFATYLSPFTWRYGSEEMRHLWSEGYFRCLLRRIWVALAEVQAEVGLVSPAELADLRAHADQIDVQRALEIEERVQHDLVAELRTFAEQSPLGGGRLHMGATSADISDNAEMLRIREALGLIERRLAALLKTFLARIEGYKAVVCMGYTHLQPAEPTTIGYRLAVYGQELLADLEELWATRAMVKGKGLKGAVGTSSAYTRLLEERGMSAAEMEKKVMAKLGLPYVLVATQVYPRKFDWLVLNVLASIAESLHKFAFDLRLLQSAGFGEMAEPFGREQVGSSTMAFKRNPVISERICSLARFIRGLPQVAWDNAANSLLERTLDDSANRRLLLPEGFLATDELLLLAQKVIEGLVIYEEQLKRNLDAYGPFISTEALLMELVKAGADRQEMHELIRQYAMQAWQAVWKGEPNPLPALLSQEPRIAAHVPQPLLARLLDTATYIGDVMDRCERFIAQARQTLATAS
ncbi:MAG: adenylosuccinate lyase [Chloroflexi bacterium]|nr:adenylosuccinate lyase [Chloroflexota bacterium]MCL5074534.1 adenylosuccinate lyase [Chloroflexota bacterium]